MSYGSFADFYDRLMTDCDYSARADYLLGLFCKFDKKPNIVLDLCCGTGSLSLELVKRGCEVVSVDGSAEMLSVANEKAKNANVDLLCICQRADELDLFGTVQGAVCTLDSINHIVDADELRLAFNRVSLFLEQGCLFIFDVNSLHKHQYILSNNTFVIDEEDVYCVWQNSFDYPYTDIFLDFFNKKEDSYIRSSEEFTERYYSHDELVKFGEDAGFVIEAVYSDMTQDEVKKDTQRIIYVMRKK